MLKWLRGGNASQRVGVIETVKLDGKRSVKLVRRDNIEHLVLVGGRTDVVIEPNIVRRPAPKPAHRPASETRGLPPPGVPARALPLAESPPNSRPHDLGELTRRLEAELRGSPPLRRQSPPLRMEAGSPTQSDATSLDFEPRSKPEPDAGAEPGRTEDPGRDPIEEAVSDDMAEKDPARC